MDTNYILLIDNQKVNHTFYKYLTKFLNEHSINFVEITSIKDLQKIKDKSEHIKGAIFSGSAKRILRSHSKTNIELMTKVIETFDVPILGICYGMQFLNFFCKGGINELPEFCNKKIFVKTVKKHKLLKNMNQNFYAECRNHDIVVEPGTNTNVLAKNRDSIQVTANDKLKFYGTQFHPELKKSTYPILLNFIHDICMC